MANQVFVFFLILSASAALPSLLAISSVITFTNREQTHSGTTSSQAPHPLGRPFRKSET